MKCRIPLSIALVLSIVLSLGNRPSIAKAQTERVFVADTGIITLAPSQKLSVIMANTEGDFHIIARFKRMNYAQGVCDGGVCKLVLTSQITSEPLTLPPGEAASIACTVAGDTRVVVLSNGPNVRVTAQIIDANTGKVTEVTGLDIEVNVIE